MSVRMKGDRCSVLGFNLNFAAVTMRQICIRQTCMLLGTECENRDGRGERGVWMVTKLNSLVQIDEKPTTLRTPR